MPRDPRPIRRQSILVDDEEPHQRPMLASLRRGTFVKAVAVLAGGAASAQVVNALAAPILTRLYNPSQIGLLGLCLAYISIASVALSLRYEQAIVVPAESAMAGRLATIALRLLVPVTLAVLAILVFLIASEIGGFGALPMWTVALIGLSLLAFGLTAILRYWLIRAGRFDLIARVVVGQSVGRAVSQVAFGAGGLGLAGLLAGEVLGRLIGLLRMFRTAWPALSAAVHEPLDRGLKSIAFEYAQFPLAGVPSSVLNALASQVPVPLLVAYYGLPAAGFFSLVQRVLAVPLAVIGASVADALLGRISDHARAAPDRAERLFRLTAVGLLAIGAPIAVVVVAAAPPTFELIFGTDWRDAGRFAAVMAPWYTAALVVSPLSRVVLVYRGQVSKLVYDVLSFAVAVGSISFAAAAGAEPLEAVWYLSIGQAGSYCVYLVILYRMVSRRGTLGSTTRTR